MELVIKLTPEEAGLAGSYARMHSVTVAEAAKRALMEHIEDEFDAAEADAAMKEYENDPVSYTQAQLEELLDL